MKAYPEKFMYLAERIGWSCCIASHYGEADIVTDLHHYRIHNLKWVRKKYPLFVDSLLNLMPVNNAWHLQHGSFGKIPEIDVAKYERFLERHPKIAKWVNDVS